MAQSKSTSMDPAQRESARQLGKMSLGFSIAGIVIGVIIIIITIPVRISNESSGNYWDN